VRDDRLLRTVEPDVVTLQDLFNSAVHEWTAEVDRQRERERQRGKES
jgi:DNA-binding protein YbaB